MDSRRGSKVIHMVRHGQSFHNVNGHIKYPDVSLTNFGFQQAKALHAHLDVSGIRAEVKLVVVSPLMRTLQTTAAAWGGDTMLEKESPGDLQSIFMMGGLGEAPHAPIMATPQPLKFVATELCREVMGIQHICNRRSDINFYKKSFPSVDFSEIESDEDTQWMFKEDRKCLLARAKAFIRWLLDRPESHIAVVSHGGFISAICHVLGANISDLVDKANMQKFFQNCEMRTMEIWDCSGSDCLSPFSGRLVAASSFEGGFQFNKSTVIPAEEQAAPSYN